MKEEGQSFFFLFLPEIPAMKKLLSVLLFLFALCASNAQDVDVNGCTLTLQFASVTETYEAYGDVYVERDIKKFSDLNVRVVTNPGEATFFVYRATDTPRKCGEWRFMDRPDKAKFIVYFVKEGDFLEEDFTIYYVSDRSKAGFR